MTLEEHLKTIDPEMNSDRVNALVSAIQEKIDNAREEGRSDGLSNAQDLVEEKDVECTAKLKEYAATVDDIHTAKLDALAEAISEDHGKRLKTLVEQMDTVYTKKLNTLYESLDKDHADKTRQLLEAMDADRSAKLRHVADVFEEAATERVKSFMDTYIEEAMPTATSVDAAKLDRLEEAMDQLREILVVNDDFVQEHVKEALIDVNEQLETKHGDVNDLMVENMGLRKQIKKNEASNLLESITADMKPAQAAFVKKYFKDESDAKVISENKDEAIRLFEAEEADETDQVLNKARGSHVDIPEDEPPVIEENVDESNVPDVMDLYANKIQRSSSIMSRVN